MPGECEQDISQDFLVWYQNHVQPHGLCSIFLRYHFFLDYVITLKNFSREQREILITGKMVWGFIVICWISNWMAKVIEADRKGMRNKNTKITKDEIKISCQGREWSNRSQVMGEPQKLPKTMIETEFLIQMDIWEMLSSRSWISSHLVASRVS